MDGQGNLEKTWKVRNKSGNLKINGYGRQTSENLFILFKREKMYFFIRATVSTIKLKNKNDFFFICQRVWKTAKSVKNQGKVREF